MYYNIKIKANGSEFSLESNSKEITQREMDLYFADMFGASLEFRSQIKKIEITNPQVKSINDFENANLEAQMAMSAPQKVEIPIEKPMDAYESFKNMELEYTPTQLPNQTQTPAQTLVPEPSESYPTYPAFSQEPSIDFTPNSFEQNEITQPYFNSDEFSQTPTMAEFQEQSSAQINEQPSIIEQIQEQPIFIEEIQEEPTFAQDIQNESTTVEKIEEQPSIVEKIEEQPPIPQNEIDELINMAQKKLEMVDTNSKIESILFPNEKTNDLEKLSINAKKGLKMASATHEEQKVMFENNNQALINDIFNSNQQENPSYQVDLNKIEATLAPMDSNDSMPTLEPMEYSQQSTPAIDFNQYISNFNTNELTEQFVICAYFVKYILREPSFTMKFINGKLFAATGKIADMSIVDDLVQKEYIKIIETPSSRTYCISQKGEEYFHNLK